MSYDDPLVFISFDLPWSGDFFTLDDPIRGQLDGDYGLSGDVPVDVTRFVRSSQIVRGRSNEFEQIGAGTCVLRFRNNDRRFDPAYDEGPYTSSIGYLRDENDEPLLDENGDPLFDEEYVPGESNITRGKRIQVLSPTGLPRFTGIVDDWDYEYDIHGNSIAVATCIDGLGSLAGMVLEAITPPEEQSGARVSRILNRPEVNYPATRDIADGLSTLAGTPDGDIDEGVGVTDYLQKVQDAEQGRLFDSLAGQLTFRDRHYVARHLATTVVIDDQGNIPFSGVARTEGKEMVRNRIQASRAGGSTEIAIDDESVKKHGTINLVLDELPLSTDSQTSDLVEFLVGAYGQSKTRFASLTIPLIRLSDEQRNALWALDIGDPINVVFTPNGIGHPIEQICVVEGHVDDNPRPGYGELTLMLSRAEQTSLFILDDPVYGALDGAGRIAF